MKKAIIVLIAAVFCLGAMSVSFAADKDTAKTALTVPVAKTGAAMPPKMPKGNFSMLYGTVQKIDNSNPASVKVEIKNEADNTVHTVEVLPATNVSKATDISELKTGENVRVMARKVDAKEVAMGVMFGKIRKPAPIPARPAAANIKAASTQQPKK